MTHRHTRLALGSGTALLTALGLCVAMAEPAREALPPLPAFRIIYSTDTLGQLDTCGCSGGQHGGLPRRATLLRTLAEGGVPTLVIDGGGVASAENQVPYLAEAHAAMGYGLILPTASDTEYGVPEAFGGAGIAVVERPAARTGGPLATHVLEVDGWKVVVIVGPDEPDADLEFLAGRVTGRDAGATGDVRVLITRLSPEGNARLAALLGDKVDLILGASSPARSRDYRDPIEPGPAIPAVSRGKALTVVDVFADAQPTGRDAGATGGEDSQPGAAVLHARFEPVAPGLYENEVIRAIVDRYYAEAAPTSRPEQQESDTEDWVMRGYADASVCGTCHVSAYAAWQTSAHAKAIPTLREQDRLVDECLECHSEEFRRNGAFDPESVVPGDGVTCSTCHGKGLVHAITGEAGRIGPGATPEECMACHNEEQQPLGFDHDASWEKIKHGLDTH